MHKAQRPCASGLFLRDIIMKTVRTGVIGVGYLGQFHTQKYAQLTPSHLVGVYDLNQDRAKEIANQYEVTAFSELNALIEAVDAVSIAASTPYHYDIAHQCLSQGVHVLIEKPITATLAEADALIALAKKNNCIIQVGHLERFNNAIISLNEHLTTPRFIDSARLSTFKMRGSDVSVILDLMIHDIDIIQSLVHAEITSIAASGAAVLTSHIDICNARVEFANGCIANVTASRISLTNERRLALFQPETYFDLDLAKKHLSIHQKGNNPEYPSIEREKRRFPQGDPLKTQIEAFLDSVITGTPPLVCGQAGRDALAIAHRITDAVNSHNDTFPF